MGRIVTIENTAASGLPQYNNLKIIVRGKPRFIDPQLDGGILRFAIKRGFNFSAIIPDNQVEIAQDCYKDSTQVVMTSRPSWMTVGTLVRIGNSEAIGELHIVNDTIDAAGIGLEMPLISNYSASQDQEIIPVVSLLGTPCGVYSPGDRTVMKIDSWYKIVPSDVLLLSKNPDVLESLQEYTIKRADFIGTRAGLLDEPATVYQYQIELATKTGLLPFVPDVGLQLYLKALPLFFREEWGFGDIPIPSDVGPCVLDAFYGDLLDTNNVVTKLGVQAWDAFGSQTNSTPSGYSPPLYDVATTYSLGAFVTDALGVIYKSLVDNNLGQPLSDNSKWLKNASRVAWQEIPSNHLILERPISSDSMLFWQRITGNFQYQKAGYFQAELTSGETVSPIYFSVDPVYDLCISSTPHGFITGEETQVASTSSLPTGLSTGIYYFIIVVTPTTFKLAATLANAKSGTAIDLGDEGVGIHRCTDPNTGKFSFSTGLLVPKWPTDHEYGWVIPLFSRSDVTCVVQYEPQEQQIFEIPSNTLTFIRPRVRLIFNTIMSGSIPLITAGDVVLTTSIVFTATPSTDKCTTIVDHGFTTGVRVQFTTTGTLPAGLALLTDYYVIVDSSNTFRLADTLEHAIAEIDIINMTDTGVGTHRCSNPNINFMSEGVKAGHFFSVAGTKYTIANVTTNTVTITEPFPVTTTAASYDILEQDLTPIDRVLVSFKGSPNSRVEIRDWQYDGTIVSSLSYYILGTEEAYGLKRWLAGGFSVKPLFYNLAVLRARYSDGVSRYNAGQIYV
jgi:hypothetical protein